MKLSFLNREDLQNLVYQRPDDFMERIASPEVLVVRNFYDGGEILGLRRQVFETGLQTEASWHPLLDDCPDYHRLHDNYPKAHVKAKMHGFYFHGWLAHNRNLFSYFHEIFEMKGSLGKVNVDEHLGSRPSEGFIARVNFQNYPRGGGYISEHADPHSRLALIQTLVQASTPSKDFSSGGLFARAVAGSEKVYLDYHTQPGDLMLLSPAIPHGVDPVDEGEDYEWRLNSGKWTILPLFVASDHPSISAEKPRELQTRPE